MSPAGVAARPRTTAGPVRDGQLTGERILDAAGRCFAERGVSATSVTDVARAAACSRPTVYRWFDDRDALLEAFVHRAARRIGARVAAEAGAYAIGLVFHAPSPRDVTLAQARASVAVLPA